MLTISTVNHFFSRPRAFSQIYSTLLAEITPWLLAGYLTIQKRLELICCHGERMVWSHADHILIIQLFGPMLIIVWAYSCRIPGCSLKGPFILPLMVQVILAILAILALLEFWVFSAFWIFWLFWGFWLLWLFWLFGFFGPFWPLLAFLCLFSVLAFLAFSAFLTFLASLAFSDFLAVWLFWLFGLFWHFWQCRQKIFTRANIVFAVAQLANIG